MGLGRSVHGDRTVCGPASSSREARPTMSHWAASARIDQLPRTGRTKPRDVARHRVKPHRTSATNALARRRRLLRVTDGWTLANGEDSFPHRRAGYPR